LIGNYIASENITSSGQQSGFGWSVRGLLNCWLGYLNIDLGIIASTETAVIFPAIVTAAGVVIAMVPSIYPTYFGITEGSINIATVWSPTAAMVGASPGWCVTRRRRTIYHTLL